MDNMTFLGCLVVAATTLGGFVVLVQKFTEPINELRVVMQKVLDRLDFIDDEKKVHKEKLDHHGEWLGRLDQRVGKIETRIDIYHDKE